MFGLQFSPLEAERLTVRQIIYWHQRAVKWQERNKER